MDDKNFSDPKIAQDWIQTIESENASIRHQDIYPRLRDWADRVAPQEILEIGAGQGACSAEINLQFGRYTGVDASPLLIQRARDLYEVNNRTFLEGNAYALPFPDGAFDAVFSVAVWHLLHDLQLAAKEMSRILRDSGNFLIITANPSAYSLWTDRYSETKIEGLRFEGTSHFANQSVLTDVLYLHSLDSIAGSLMGAGLEVQKFETFRNSNTQPEQHQFVAVYGKKLGYGSKASNSA